MYIRVVIDKYQPEVDIVKNRLIWLRLGNLGRVRERCRLTFQRTDILRQSFPCHSNECSLRNRILGAILGR